MVYDHQARIIENGKARQEKCCGYTPVDALFYLVQAAHVRKGATIHLGTAFWDGDEYVSRITTYRHIPERDRERYSAWELEGSEWLRYISIKPE